MTTDKTYDESSFDVLEGLEPVKKVPGMYTRTKNPMHITQEVLDNAIDEAQNGHATKIAVTVHKDNSITVEDNGRGIPVGMHPTQKVPVVVLAFTRLHAGAKFKKGDSYGRSGGLHGVGVSVTNALSHHMTVTVRREGAVHQVNFVEGDRQISEVKPLGKCSVAETGTTVHFLPDAKYFESGNLPMSELQHLLESKAMLLPGLDVSLTIESTGQVLNWKYVAGLEEKLKANLAEEEIVGDIFAGDGYLLVDGENAVAGDGAKWAVAWTNNPGKGDSYVNMIPTPQGGTHENGLRAGLFEALKDYCEHHGLLPRGITLQAEDLWSRANFILSANIQQTQFQGQTKDKLTSREVVRTISNVCKPKFEQWLLANQESAKKIAELAIKQASARSAMGKTIEKRKGSGVAVLPGKLTDCKSSDITRNEIFFVEGDSAGGGCKQARDKEYQAILPLRGKVLNTWNVPRNKLFANKEVHDISVALGVDPHDEDSADSVLENLRYGKLCILADADVDGAHIQTLLLCLFYKHFPKLIEHGHVFIARPPLFRIDVPSKGKGKPEQKIYCLTDEEKDQVLARKVAEGFKEEQLIISRFKGLGEMMPEHLTETVLNPDTRLLLQVTIEDSKKVFEVMQMLMAQSEADARKRWLEEEGATADIDA